jgi:hypothetical protein
LLWKVNTSHTHCFSDGLVSHRILSRNNESRHPCKPRGLLCLHGKWSGGSDTEMDETGSRIIQWLSVCTPHWMIHTPQPLLARTADKRVKRNF